jgi:hypothetical protein
MELILKAYYQLIEATEDLPEWRRKFEDDIGLAIHYMVINFDESVRDALVEKSELFKRFVSLFRS